MNILVTGANGQLGNEMRIIARESNDRYIFSDVVGDDIVKLDITDPQAVSDMVNAQKIDIIVNCAAYTNVDKAESDQAFAEKLNAEAVANLAAAMEATGGLLIHVSTDYVFGGSLGNTPRTEEEPANPTGVYGLTKLHGEEAIKRSGCRYVILRTAWLYSEFGKNFVKTMLNLTATKPQLKVVFDQVGTPTYALDLARAIEAVINDYAISKAENQKPKTENQIYHYSNEGVCSWYDFTKMIAEYSGNTACDIQPCHSDEFPSPVVRPPYSVLDKTKIKKDLGITIPFWTDSLRACLANMK